MTMVDDIPKPPYLANRTKVVAVAQQCHQHADIVMLQSEVAELKGQILGLMSELYYMRQFFGMISENFSQLACPPVQMD